MFFSFSLQRSFFSPLRFLRRRSPSASEQLQERLVLEPELAERLQWTTNSLLTTKAHRVPFRHLLLHGPPGTGKTLFARTYAARLSAHFSFCIYAYINANVNTFVLREIDDLHQSRLCANLEDSQTVCSLCICVGNMYMPMYAPELFVYVYSYIYEGTGVRLGIHHLVLHFFYSFLFSA